MGVIFCLSGFSFVFVFFCFGGVLISIVYLFTHSQHLYHLFENDRFFSALSPLERDLSYRTEMVSQSARPQHSAHAAPT